MEQSPIVVKCCKCHRVRLDGRWIRKEQEEVAAERYSHSYCPVCLIKVHAELEICEVFAR